MKKIAAPSKILFLYFLALGLTGCVKDVDFDQVKEINLQPTAVIDIINFDMEADLSQNTDPGIPVKVEKTVPFNVLTEDLKESVVRVDFQFDYFNSLPRTFQGYIYFIDDRNRVKQQIPIEIFPGSKENPEKDTTISSMEGKDLEALHEATQVRVELEMQPGPGLEGGELKIRSVAAFQFLF